MEAGAAVARRLAATKNGHGWLLAGHKSVVLDGHAAGLILAVARTDAGLSLFAVDAGSAGLSRTVPPTLDQTRKLARLEFSSAAGHLVGAPGDASAVLARVLDVAAISLAAVLQAGQVHRAVPR